MLLAAAGSALISVKTSARERGEREVLNSTVSTKLTGQLLTGGKVISLKVSLSSS